ncbi:MAG: preprotein translocase subunit SecY, partial [Clostridia bacterium]|nr:preprotein translocase subunit SecY [Clostridia bacterium]
MFKVLGNAWKIPDLRKKILFTLLILFIYRLGCYVPIPGVNVTYIAEQVNNLSLLGFVNTFSGGALSNMTVFALGITPYINASIIMNLLCVAIPALERLSKDGEDGPKKIQAITRYLGVALGLVQAIGIIFGLGEQAVTDRNWFNYVTIILCMTAGTALVMWLGELINEKGIGNGISLIIFIGIVSSVLPTFIALIQGTFGIGAATGGVATIGWWVLPVTVVFVLVILVAITYVDMGERRVPVQYAKKVVGRKMYGGQSTYIPMKLNQSGVMPLIFAATFIQFPGMIGQLFGTETNFYQFWNKYMASGSVIYMVLYLLLILFFTYFYSQIAFNPIEVSKNMQQYGGFIPGIRPGKPTSDHLAKILSRITLFGALFLAVIAAVPTLLGQLTSVFSAFGATSVLIMVSVAL